MPLLTFVLNFKKINMKNAGNEIIMIDQEMVSKVFDWDGLLKNCLKFIKKYQ